MPPDMSGDARIDGVRIRVGPLEASDGTPIVDVKITLSYLDDA